MSDIDFEYLWGLYDGLFPIEQFVLKGQSKHPELTVAELRMIWEAFAVADRNHIDEEL